MLQIEMNHGSHTDIAMCKMRPHDIETSESKLVR